MIKYIIIDVDGTLTDGGIYYDGLGNELKKFCTKDAAGIFAARAIGINVVVLTGRECAATTRRLTELGVKDLYQNVKDKTTWMKEWMNKNAISKDDVGYIGDDLNDLETMKFCGFVGCPFDACYEVKQMADYVSNVTGGHGAARDVIEWYLKDNGVWDKAIKIAYGGI